MNILILGASGMLGQALREACIWRRHPVISDRVEITDDAALIRHICDRRPDLIINSAALCDLNACESDPDKAYRVNARPALVIADNFPSIRFVQISSDQAANPLNEYAHSKAAAERYTLLHPQSLVVRTNIVGPKNMIWAFDAIDKNSPITLFDDYFTASIDVWNFSKTLLDLLEQHPSERGILNISGRAIVSKKRFIEALAARMGRELTQAKTDSVNSILPKRPLHSWLDISRVEKLLNRQMPGLDEVIEALVERRKSCTNPSQLATG